MGDRVSTEEVGSRPSKMPKLEDKACVESKPISTYARLRIWEPEKDEYFKQYLLFHYQFHTTQGFGIEWDKFDYFFNLCHPYDGSPEFSTIGLSNEERLKRLTLRVIAKYNEKKGTNIVFVENISANYQMISYHTHWITFRARDMSSPSPESKIYQVKTSQRSRFYWIRIFRVKPTDEEMMAAPVRVKTPFPIDYDIDKPPVVFRRARPGEDPVPGTPFVFSRGGGTEFASDSDSESEEEKEEEEEDEDGIEAEVEEAL